jgi:hypothetical protein
MKHNNRGFAGAAILLIVFAVLTVGGVAYFAGKSSTQEKVMNDASDYFSIKKEEKNNQQVQDTDNNDQQPQVPSSDNRQPEQQPAAQGAQKQTTACAVEVKSLPIPSSLLVNGTVTTFYKFELKNTSSSNACRVTEITFTVNRNPASISLSDFHLINSSNTTVGTFTYNPYVNGSPMSVFQFFTSNTNGIVLSPLSSETFSLRAGATGISGTSTASVSVKMDQSSTYSSGASASSAGMIVLDIANNEYPVYGTVVPTTSQVLTN